MPTNRVPAYFVEVLRGFGLSHDEINIGFEEFKINRGINDWKDYVWQKLQEINFELASNVNCLKDFYRQQNDLYFEMLYLRRKYQKQKANDLQELFLESRLESIERQASFKMLFSLHGRCPHAIQFRDKWQSKELLLTKIRSLNDSCTSENGCTCAVLSKVDR